MMRAHGWGEFRPDPIPRSDFIGHETAIEYWTYVKRNNLKMRDAQGNLVDAFANCPPRIKSIIRLQELQFEQSPEGLMLQYERIVARGLRGDKEGGS